jgi:putative colanic acid biosynthesis acetyltransferase WcaF
MNELPKVDLKTYSPGNIVVKKNVLIRGLWYYINALCFRSYLLPSCWLKRQLLHLFGAKVGNGVVIKPGVNIKYPWLLNVGDYIWIGEGVWIDNLADVVIESNACISQGAMLLTGNHNYKRTSFDLMTGKIIIHEGSWIGARSIVCPGVTCKTHSVLTAGSVAVRDLEEYSIYQGNPAIKIRERKLDNESLDSNGKL